MVIFMCNHCTVRDSIADELTDGRRGTRRSGLPWWGSMRTTFRSITADFAGADECTEAESRRYHSVSLRRDSRAGAALQSGLHARLFTSCSIKIRKLVYRGQLDDSRPGSGVPVTGKNLRAALDATLAERLQ